MLLDNSLLLFFTKLEWFYLCEIDKNIRERSKMTYKVFIKSGPKTRKGSDITGSNCRI